MALLEGTKALSLFLRHCYLPAEHQELFPLTEAGDPAGMEPCQQHIYVRRTQVDYGHHPWAEAVSRQGEHSRSSIEAFSMQLFSFERRVNTWSLRRGCWP